MNKRIIFTLIITVLQTSLFAQEYNVRIEGHIIGYDGKSELNYGFSTLNYHIPYDGIEKIKPDSTGRFTILKQINETKFFTLIYSNKQIDTIRHECLLIVQPNKSYSIISQGRSTKEEQNMSGSYSKDKSYVIKPHTPDIFSLNNTIPENSLSLNMDIGQMYYNLIDNGTVGSLFRENWDLMNPDELLTTLENRINSQVNKFRELLDAGSIDAEFFQIAKLNVEYTQAYRLTQTIQDTWSSPNLFGIEDSTISEKLKQIYMQVFKKYPVDGVPIEQVQGFPKYIDLYLCYLSCLENLNKSGQWYSKGMPLKTVDHIKTQLSSKSYTQYKLNTTLSMTTGLELKSSQKAKQFMNENPEINKSDYGKMLTDYLIPRAEYFDSLANQKPGNNIIFLDDSTSINELDEILKYFSGKAILIDFWGTWCYSCRAQFKYSKTLVTFLKKHGIEMLYIAKEYNTTREDWKKVITAYDLTGYHFLLTVSFKKTLAENNVFITGFPSYVLIDKNGKILKLENLHPSDGSKFLDKLEELIK